MRGKRCLRHVRRLGLRIIPAHAGQTRPCPCRRACRPDHPRACGANDIHDLLGHDSPGSSPRMRGKLRRCRRHCFPYRIIPAHAGQTWSIQFHPSWNADHPRACGANSDVEVEDTTFGGSSPRMRGKQRHVRQVRADHRIIPAHAGQTNTYRT